MSAIMESLGFIEHLQAASFDPAQPVVFPVRRPARRRKEERWTTTLSPRDLRCLLSALEEQVIPTMIVDYSPARAAPLEGGVTQT